MQVQKIVITCNSNQKWNDDTYQCECKDYCTCKKDCSFNSTTCICENNKYLKTIVDSLVIRSDETINVTDSVIFCIRFY